MQLSGVRPSVCLSVCPIHPQHAAAVGLLLCARQPGEIDRLLHAAVSSAAARRAAANACSATFSVKGRGCAQTC